MINILPIEERKAVIREYKNRRLLIVGIVVIIVMLISFILLASLMGILILKKRSLDFSLTSQEVNQRFNLPAILSEAKTANQQAEIILAAKQDGFKSAPILNLLTSYLIDQITIRKINFVPQEKSQILLMVEGRAKARKDLLDFIERLKSEVAFVEIDSPISNLAREYDNDFKITIKINPELINISNF